MGSLNSEVWYFFIGRLYMFLLLSITFPDITKLNYFCSKENVKEFFLLHFPLLFYNSVTVRCALLFSTSKTIFRWFFWFLNLLNKKFVVSCMYIINHLSLICVYFRYNVTLKSFLVQNSLAGSIC